MQLSLFNIEKKKKYHRNPGDKKMIFQEILNTDLNFTDSNNINRRHYWHSFPAKFPPQLPSLFITYLTEPSDIVLDPMMGSGTTLIEANLLGRRSFGMDIDPLAIVNVNAKSKNLNKQNIERYLNKIVYNSLDHHKSDSSYLEKLLHNRFDGQTLGFLDYWFTRETQFELIALITEIEKVKDDVIRKIFLSIFSSVIITKSGGVSLAMDLAHTRPHRVGGKKIKSAIQEFSAKTRKILTENHTSYLTDDTFIIEGDAKNIPIKNNIVDIIVTSPPYANNAIDYMRAHKFSLVWFGFSINELKELRKQYIGAESKIAIQDSSFPEIVKQKIDDIAKVKNSKSNAFRRYCFEMLNALSEMYRVLKKGSPCVLVVASSKISNIDVETHKCLASLGEGVGFEVVDIGKRIIDRNKRMMPFGNNKGNSIIERRMHEEYVIGFWKN